MTPPLACRFFNFSRIAAWFESDIDVKGKMDIHHLHAGKDEFDYDALPNKAAEACAIRLFDDDN